MFAPTLSPTRVGRLTQRLMLGIAFVFAGVVRVLAQARTGGAFADGIDDIGASVFDAIDPMEAVCFSAAALLFFMGAAKAYTAYTTDDQTAGKSTAKLLVGSALMALAPILIDTFFAPVA